MKVACLLVWIAVIVMAILKFTGVTPDLSWGWVTCPIWGTTIVYYGGLLLLFLGSHLIPDKKKKG